VVVEVAPGENAPLPPNVSPGGGDVEAPAPEVVTPPTSIDLDRIIFQPPAITGERIVIPSIGVDSALSSAPFVGTTWDITGLTDDVAHLEGTVAPGQPGLSVLAGHVMHERGLGPFRHLEQLTTGDYILIQEGDIIYRYRVELIEEVAPSDTAWMEEESTLSELVLVTCSDWDDESWSYLSRVLVKASFSSWVDASLDPVSSSSSWTRNEVNTLDLSGKWETQQSEYTSGEDYQFSLDENAELTFSFEGERLRLQYLTHWDFGIFEVYVDGQLLTTIDAYSPSSRVVATEVFYLDPGEHTVKIVKTGEKNPDSVGTVIALDVIDIWQQ
jgi:LPXTG-site transpeptidase (sortase) family protein